MALSIQDSRILLKRSTNASEAPAVAPSSDFTDGTWTSLDVYIGEQFANTIDEKLYIRFTNNIRQIAVADSPTVNRLTYWDASGHLGNIAAPTDGYYLKYTNASGYIWAAAGGAESQNWNDVLTLGRTTDGVNPFISAGDAIQWHNTTASFTTTLTNDQATAANRTVYLPKFDGELAYHATGVPLTTNYVLKGTTNGAITSSSLIYDDGTNVGIGTASPTSLLYLYKNTNGLVTIDIENPNTDSSGANQRGVRMYNTASDVSVFSKVGSGALGVGQYIPNTNLSRSSSLVITNNLSSQGNGQLQINGEPILFNVGYDASYSAMRLSSAGLRVTYTGDFHNNATARLHVVGTTSDSFAYALKVDNSSSSALLHVRNDGLIAPLDGGNIQLGTTTGTKIGTATTEKIGFWNATPIVQPTTGVAAATLVGGGGTALTDTDTFDGYTIKQIVKALINTGLLA